MDDQIALRRRQKKRIILNSAAAAASVVIIVVVSIVILHTANSKFGIRTDSEELFKLSLTATSCSLSNASLFLDTLQIPINDRRFQAVISNCKHLLGNAIYQLKDSADKSYRSYSRMSDIMSWLSSSISNQKDCLESFEGTRRGELRQKVEAVIENSTEHTSNSLAVAAGIMGTMKKKKTGDSGIFPDWASMRQKTFLTREGVLNQVWAPNVIVAKDGTGHVESIQEALNLVPDESIFPFFIYIKEGIYEEYVVVENTKWNVYMIGDGMYSTIITGNKNVVDYGGMSTRLTATFSVSGLGFVAKDIGFQNTAGPEKFQAIALYSNADQSIFYRCLFDAYQDTLCAQSNRQFYRECVIIGTVDFIFGSAAVVFQKCNILPREPLPNQENTITAQGKDQPIENSGFSILECTIAPYGIVTRPTYLGRPWRNYSTTVVMKTEISAIVDPAGWMPWQGSMPPDTINYAEFQNTGPGAETTGRVVWPGYRSTISVNEAIRYTVDLYINGAVWIPSSGVPFEPSL